MSDASQITHAVVLPDDGNFFTWYRALKPYIDAFSNVSIVRGIAGSDLNPYRHVTVLNLPNFWLNNDPLYHIRRIFPSVVLVDVIDATTPDQLTSVLQRRIANRDRYGREDNNGNVDERFVLAWATDYRPYNLVQPFTENPTGTAADVLGLEIEATAGANVLASAKGKVTRQWAGSKPDDLRLGKYVQVTTIHNGKKYVVTYAGLSTIHVPLHTEVIIGDKLGEAETDKFLVIVQADNGLSGYRLPNIINPNSLIYINKLRVRALGSGLRVRKIPNGEVLGQIQPYDFVIPREEHGRVLGKTGQEGEWINIRMPDGRKGFVAAWFLEATEYRRFALEVNPVGVNLDAKHPLGTPDPSRLGNIGWVRFGYNVSNNVGSEDIVAAYNRYAPLAEQYARAGYYVCFTTSHQTYGESKGFPVWSQMQDSHWRTLTDRFADMMGRIAQQWANTGLVHCWQVWNEQDAPLGAIASVPMSPQNYGRMLAKVIPAIKSQDPSVFVVTGGHTSGPKSGPEYIRQAIRMTDQAERLDGVAFHPYGRGTNLSSPYTQFGHIDESMQGYTQIMPDKPVWITEWGVLDRPFDTPNDISNYALAMINHLKARYPAQVAALIWYAWAQGMHNGYGIVGSDNQPRSPLTERFLQS